MDRLHIANSLSIPLREIELTAIRAQGAGGQHVNKTATGIHLRFDIPRSSLPDELKERLLQLADHRINKQGVLVIKAQQSRSQEQNRQQALTMLRQLLLEARKVRKSRKKTRPTRSSQEKRLEQKAQRSQLKAWRKKDFE